MFHIGFSSDVYRRADSGLTVVHRTVRCEPKSASTLLTCHLLLVTEDSMKSIRRIASADFLMVLVAAVFFGGCGESTTSPPVAQETAKISPEQELAALTKKAEAGDAEAQAKLGLMYATGKGVPKDVAKAVEWFQKAAALGNSDAQNNLGVSYANGYGVPKDAAKAVEWYQKAAAQGNPNAQAKLGSMYDTGEGVPKDAAKAVEWFQKAAALGNSDAQLILGIMYDNGDGVPKDGAKAVEWYQKAAAQGNDGAQFNLGSMYFKGDGVPMDIAKAMEWFQKAAAQGSVRAQVILGMMYSIGSGVPKDMVLAYAWSNIASVNGDADALGYRNIAEAQLSASQLTEAQRLSSKWKKGQILAREGTPATASASTSASPGTLSKKGTGTIFVVSKTGHAITNQHVAGVCTELRIQGRDGLAKLVTEDLVNDLSLVQIPGTVTDTAAIAAEPAKLRQGEDIVVFGFPLSAVLSSGGNLTPGVVSAMTGLGNNTNQIQITAPIQPGSSGSPVLNKKGEVVGVVSMKLSDSKMAKATGSIGQNVNFAVSGQTLKTFLDTHKVEYRTGGVLSFSKNTADLADEARKWTLVVECWK
jgi:TPR repeat protein